MNIYQIALNNIIKEITVDERGLIHEPFEYEMKALQELIDLAIKKGIIKDE